MIEVTPSPTADTRTCDVTKVTKDQLLDSSLQHIGDVVQGLNFFVDYLMTAAGKHDYDKLTDIDWFHSDFQTDFKKTGWWDNHRRIHRHHLAQEDGVPINVNLLDILEYIADCVMAGMARTGEVYELEMTPALLDTAFTNTVELLKANVTLVKPVEEPTKNPLRPCERSIKLKNHSSITPDDINSLASNAIMFAKLIQQVEPDEAKAIAEAVEDNWNRFHASWR